MPPSAAYIARLAPHVHSDGLMHGVLRRDQLRGHSVLLAALQWVSVTVLLRAAGRIAATASRGSSSSSKDPITAFDRHGDDLVACAKLHSMVYSLQAFADRVQRWREPSAGADGSTVSSATQAVVHKLCSLFGINQLLTAAAQVPGRARRQSSRSIGATHSLQRNPPSHPNIRSHAPSAPLVASTRACCPVR